MIVRTYGRRSRGIGNEDVLSSEQEEDPYSFSSQEFQDCPQPICNFTFSSQDSTRCTWSFEDNDNDNDLDPNPNPNPNSLQLISPVNGGGERRLKKLRREKVAQASGYGGDLRRERGGGGGEGLRPNATLMETQEYGEMMECVDEVDFALDGLRKGVGVRVRRASLLALLNVCGTAQQRRLLKAQGMSKTIIDAILNLSFDDSPSNLAAATLFYVLTSDGQDSYLLESSSSIRFLLQLLKPTIADPAVHKAHSISQKLLAFRKDTQSQNLTKRVDSSSTSIVYKVLETLINCKDLKASIMENDDISRPELNPNWVSLLTMEKACLSTISVEDTIGTMRKTDGNFKEKLRELGGLDAIFELAVNFYSTLEGFSGHMASSVRDSKDGSLQCLPLLLKCLKIMENALFLSKENQSHLLRLKGTLAGHGSSVSFVKLMIDLIKILSDLRHLKASSATSSPEVPSNNSNGVDHHPEFLLNAGQRGNNNVFFTSRSSQECSTSRRFSSDMGLSTSQNDHWFSSFQSGSLQSRSGATMRSGAGDRAIEISSSSGAENHVIEISSSASGLCSLTSTSSDGRAPVNDSKMSSGLIKTPCDNDDAMFIDLEGSQDPFAFDEDDLRPSKWDMLSGKRHRGRRKQKSKVTYRGAEDRWLSMSMLSQEESQSQPMLSQEESQSQPMLSQEESQSQPMLSQEEFGNGGQNGGNHHSSDNSCTTAIDEEKSYLVADCLMTAIKVLMNLTNDNASGCKQIAACGGLETLSSLIVRHFPAFRIESFCEMKENTSFTKPIPELGSQTDVRLSDQELDFLVTILGLLVNMVENDGNNRSQLAAAKVSLPSPGGLSEHHTGVVPLLCSIFLANRGASETAEDEPQSLDEEEVVLQGEKEAEKMIVEAYAALLLAFLSTESKSVRNAIANHLPDRSLKVLVPVLERFVTFHLTLDMISPETHKTVSEVIESCRLP